MEFMNGFLDEEMGNMRTFLQLVSNPPPEDWIQRLSIGGGGEHRRGDLGRHLSNIHTILVENISKIPASNSSSSSTNNITTISTSGNSSSTGCLEVNSSSFNLEHLKGILNDINSNLHRPSTATLDNIAEPTPVKIKRMSAEDKATATTAGSTTAATLSPTNSGHHNHHHMLGPLGGSTTPTPSSTPVHHHNTTNNVISNWMSWTLGRGEKKSKVSHPIPQHELRNGGSGLLLLSGGGGGKSSASAAVPPASTFYTPDVTESSSSSASLTPSPKYAASSSGGSGGSSGGGGGGGLWGSNQKSGIRKGSWKSASSISIIEDSDSESSSASSHHYRGHQPGQLQFSTLPRPRTETRTLSDYEREIHGLRSAMESLQLKLQEAERRLQQQQQQQQAAVGGSGGSSSDRSCSSAAATPPRQGSPNKESAADYYYHHQQQHQYAANADDDVKDILARLLKEEDLLRRRAGEASSTTSSSRIGGSDATPNGRMGDKELMILLQQRKIAALDEANNRLVSELSRLGERTGGGGSCGLPGVMSHQRNKKRSVQETPKTVDELLDSFNDTPV